MYSTPCLEKNVLSGGLVLGGLTAATVVELHALLALGNDAATADASHVKGTEDGRAVLATLVGAAAAGLEVSHDVDALVNFVVGGLVGTLLLDAESGDAARLLVGLAVSQTKSTTGGDTRNASIRRGVDAESATHGEGGLAVHTVRTKVGLDGDGSVDLRDAVAGQLVSW